MTPKDELLLRVDASREIGIGHVMRCLALAQGWMDAGGTACFLHAESLPAIDERLHSEGMETATARAQPGSDEDARMTAELVRQRDAACVVLDGYRFGAGYQEIVKSTGRRLLVLDDYGHAGQYAADLVLNQNLSANPDLYRRRARNTRLLLGTRYVLLQSAFRKARPPFREPASTARRVLVTLGGVDPHNVTLKVLKALGQSPLAEVEVRAVVSGGNPHAQTLEAFAAASNERVRLERNPPNLAALMEWAEVAVAASGTTTWELLYMGVPSILLSTADNQRIVAQSVSAAGAARDLGTYDAASAEKIMKAVESLVQSPSERAEMSQRGRALVDGQGVSRVVTEIKAVVISLRPAEAADARLLWDWANDRRVRSVSFDSAPIPWGGHISWFEEKRSDPSCLFYIGLDPAGTPFGQIRFDVRGQEAEVSMSVDATFRGKGYGSALILAGSRKVLDEARVQRLHAYVKPGNEPSVRAFLKAGYREAGRETIRGHVALDYTLDRGGEG